MFVIQEKVNPWTDKWKVATGYPQFKTAEEARAIILKMPTLLQHSHRVAMEYTVKRYKAVMHIEEDTAK